MTSELEQAAKAYRRAEKTFSDRRAELVELVVKAAREGMAQTEIVRITGWTRDYIYKLVKADDERRRREAQ